MSYVDLYTAAQLLRITRDELDRLLALGDLTAAPSVHGGQVIALTDIHVYLAQKGGTDGQ